MNLAANSELISILVNNISARVRTGPSEGRRTVRGGDQRATAVIVAIQYSIFVYTCEAFNVDLAWFSCLTTRMCRWVSVLSKTIVSAARLGCGGVSSSGACRWFNSDDEQPDDDDDGGGDGAGDEAA